MQESAKILQNGNSKEFFRSQLCKRTNLSKNSLFGHGQCRLRLGFFSKTVLCFYFEIQGRPLKRKVVLLHGNFAAEDFLSSCSAAYWDDILENFRT